MKLTGLECGGSYIYHMISTFLIFVQARRNDNETNDLQTAQDGLHYRPQAQNHQGAVFHLIPMTQLYVVYI